MNKTVSLICAIGGIVIGLVILVLAIIDAEISTLLWVVFTVFCFANAIINFRNLKQK